MPHGMGSPVDPRLPSFRTYLAIGLELSAGVALTLGFYTRIFAAASVPLLLRAAWLGHSANGWMFSNSGSGWEFPVF